MTKPSKDTLLKMREEVLTDLRVIRATLDLSDPDIDRAWAGIETFVNLGMRIMAKTNVSKIRSESLTLEIAARLAGHEVFDV